MAEMMDIHCHIVPAVDDGAADMDTALAMVRMEYQQGVRAVICTPHFRQGYFETSRDTVRTQFQQLEELAGKEFPDLRLYLGCEFHRHSSLIERARADTAYRMAGSDYVLLEFSGADPVSVIRRHVTELLTHGLRPVIAHAERYPSIGKVEQIRFLAESGAYIQVNAGSILGSEGWLVRRFCRKLLQEDLVHLIGSDAHNTVRRVPCIGQCGEYLERKLGTARMQKLLMENPGKLLTNEYI